MRKSDWMAHEFMYLLKAYTMKRLFLASLFSLMGWSSCVLAQPSLGTPVATTPTGEPGPLPPHVDYRTQFCQSGFGQMAKSLLAPVRLATGNLLPTCCVDGVSKEDIARMMIDGGYSPAELAAAKIKLDEAQSKSRRAAVRYLASVNCHYYPEAEAGLIAALRADRNECVRLEAALALGTCQCSTQHIVDALSITVMGCELDGNPAETSPRVRAAAQTALNRCLAQGSCQPAGMPNVPNMPSMLPPPDCNSAPPPTLPPTFSVAPANALLQPMDNFVPMMPDPVSPTLLYERQRAENISPPLKNSTVSTGQRNLYQLFVNAAYREPGQANTNGTVAPRPTPRPAHPLGLTPLGSDVQLAIPTPAASGEAPLYNK